jgi:hypothetical protein
MDKKPTLSLDNLEFMYKNLTYWDNYTGSVLMFILVTITEILFLLYFQVMTQAQLIRNDWTNQRCKPQILPFAGFINSPNDIINYTQENFEYCSQSILTNISETALEPLHFIVSTFSSMTATMEEDIQMIRAMFDKVRGMFQTIFQEIMGRLMNIMIPLQQIIITFKDLIAKIEGTMTSALFLVLGAYYSLQSLCNDMAHIVVNILIGMTVTIAILWMLPFTWVAAAALTVPYIIITVIMAIFLAFMVDVLKLNADMTLPKLKCFDKNTLLILDDGTAKKIIDIIPGDVLINNNEVTSIIKVETKGSKIYKLNNILVSDTHIVQYREKWIKTDEHPDAILVESYNEPYLYCLNTSNKIIEINNTIFTDWDEVYGEKLTILKNNNIIIINDLKDIHTYFDSGVSASTKIPMLNKECKNMKDIEIGDILENGEKVYGIVEINGKNIHKQYIYDLGKTQTIKGGNNLLIKNMNNKNCTMYFNRKILRKEEEEDKLYHLLTDKKYFYINNIKIYDYNANIDLFLDKL